MLATGGINRGGNRIRDGPLFLSCPAVLISSGCISSRTLIQTPKISACAKTTA
jgi:hypothetical protein